jgi:hypothetical protein
MTIDVADVATDTDLEAYTGGKNNLQKLLPDEWLTDPEEEYDAETNPKLALIPRQQTLATILAALKSRRPPILETDLQDVTELKRPVIFGALEIIYRASIQHDDSPNVERAKAFGKMFSDALNALQPSVLHGASASSMSIRISRG